MMPTKKTADIAAAQDPDALLDARTVSALVGFAIVTLRQWRKLGKFPEPLRVGHNVRWRAGDVRDWLKQQAAAAPPQ